MGGGLASLAFRVVRLSRLSTRLPREVGPPRRSHVTVKLLP